MNTSNQSNVNMAVFLEDGLEEKMCGLVLASGSKALSLALSSVRGSVPWPCLGLGGLSSNPRVEDKTRTENFTAKQRLIVRIRIHILSS